MSATGAAELYKRGPIGKPTGPPFLFGIVRVRKTVRRLGSNAAQTALQKFTVERTLCPQPPDCRFSMQ